MFECEQTRTLFPEIIFLGFFLLKNYIFLFYSSYIFFEFEKHENINVTSSYDIVAHILF